MATTDLAHDMHPIPRRLSRIQAFVGGIAGPSDVLGAPKPAVRKVGARGSPATPVSPTSVTGATLRAFEADVEAAMETIEVPGAAVAIAAGELDRVRGGCR